MVRHQPTSVEVERQQMPTRDENKRQFPRAAENIPVRLTLKDEHRSFEATVQTEDISLTGVFFASEFYLKPGIEMDLEFVMPNEERRVRTRGIIVREVRVKERREKGTCSGFAMRFTDYYDDAKAVLASSFLSADLDEFITDFLKRRTSKPKDELAQLRDVLIAWEVGKMAVNDGELDVIHDRIRVDGKGRIRRT